MTLLLIGPWILGTAQAAPGNAWIALSPAPQPGDLDVNAYLTDPAGWPARAQDHPHGWAVAYRGQQPPAGWTRPFVIRGGGTACAAGRLHPRFAVALEEMLPSRASAILTMLDPPDSAACSPGKPNPHPFLRDGWLGVHDGYIGIEDITMNLWRAVSGADWEAFKLAYPRDYHSWGDSMRGNAGEIYFLTFLFELAKSPEQVAEAMERTVYRLWALAGHDDYQFNLVVQSAAGTWALRYADAGPENYPVFYGRTIQGEYWVANQVPAAASAWEALPNHTLACFPAGGPVELRTLETSGVEGQGWNEARDPAGDARGARPPRLWATATPSTMPASLAYELPQTDRGLLEIWDVAGRRLLSQWVDGGRRRFTWRGQFGSGLYLARLQVGAAEARTRILVVR